MFLYCFICLFAIFEHFHEQTYFLYYLVIVHQWCRKMFQYGWAQQACVLWFAGFHGRNHTLSCAKKFNPIKLDSVQGGGGVER